jgi:hypothetical protein
VVGKFEIAGRLRIGRLELAVSRQAVRGKSQGNRTTSNRESDYGDDVRAWSIRGKGAAKYEQKCAAKNDARLRAGHQEASGNEILKGERVRPG